MKKIIIILLMTSQLNASEPNKDKNKHNGGGSDIGYHAVKEGGKALNEAVKTLDKTSEKVATAVVVSTTLLANSNVEVSKNIAKASSEFGLKVVEKLGPIGMVVAVSATAYATYQYFRSPTEQEKLDSTKYKLENTKLNSEIEHKECLITNKDKDKNSSGIPIECEGTNVSYSVHHGKETSDKVNKDFVQSLSMSTSSLSSSSSSSLSSLSSSGSSSPRSRSRSNSRTRSDLGSSKSSESSSSCLIA